MRIFGFLVLLVLYLPAKGASFSDSVGLSGPLALDTDFSDAISSLGVDVPPGDFYAGIAFSEFLLGPPGGIRTIISPIPGVNTSTISFDSPIGGVGLLARDLFPSRISAYLGGGLIESFETFGAGTDSADALFYGFTDITFDELRFTQDNPPPTVQDRIFVIDRLQVMAVPLPAAFPLFTLGLLALWRAGRRLSSVPGHVLSSAGLVIYCAQPEFSLDIK